MHKTERLYALYVGNEHICSGTIREIAEFSGRKVETASWMTTETAHKRIAKRESRGTCPTKLVAIVDEEQPLMRLNLSDQAIDVLSYAGVTTVGHLVQLSDQAFHSVCRMNSIRMEVAPYREWYLSVLEAEKEEDLQVI